MATPMKAAAASAGATRRARIGASGLPSGWRHHSTLGCSFVPRFTVALLKRSLLSPPPFMSTTFCACFWKHASYTLVSWCRYGCMSLSKRHWQIRKRYCARQKMRLPHTILLCSTMDYYKLPTTTSHIMLQLLCCIHLDTSLLVLNTVL